MVCGDEEAKYAGRYLGSNCYKRLQRIHEKLQGKAALTLGDLRDEAQLELAILDLVADPPAVLRGLFQAWDAKIGAERRLVGIAGGLVE